MLPSLPAQPLLSLLFPDPGGQPIDLARLEQRLQAAGQLRYARLPWVPGGGGAAAAPQLAVLHSSFSSEERQPVAALVHGGKVSTGTWRFCCTDQMWVLPLAWDAVWTRVHLHDCLPATASGPVAGELLISARP